MTSGIGWMLRTKMASANEVLEFLEMICKDPSVSKSVKKTLDDVKVVLKSDDDMDVKVDAAIQKIENLSLDPNLASYARTQIWNLSSLLEDCR